MSTKVKTQAQQTVTATANTQVQTALPRSRPFESAESGWESATLGSDSKLAGTPPPPEVQRRSDSTSFQNVPIFEHIPVTVQPKLVVGAHNDKYEQEADRMAEQVMAMSDNEQPLQRSLEEEDEDINLKPLSENIQRQEEDEEINLKPLGATIQRADYEDEGITLKSLDVTLQRNKQTNRVNRDGGDGSFTAGANIESKLKSNQGGGQPMPERTQNFMESRFGNDFSQVKVHTDNQAVQMNRDLNAKAFTHGNDIYFNSGQYNPESNSGKSLLAHELTHTIQQTGHTALKRIDTKAEKANKLTPTKGTKVQNLAKTIQRQEHREEESGINLKPLAASIQRADYEDEGITLKAINSVSLSTSVTSTDISVQRDEAEDIAEDKAEAEKQMQEEIDNTEGDASLANEAKDTAEGQAEKLESVAENAEDSDAAETAADELEEESDTVSETQQTEAADTETEVVETEQQEEEEEQKEAEQEQQKAIDAVEEVTGEGTGEEGEDSGGEGENSGEDDGAIAPSDNSQAAPDPQAIKPPPIKPERSPKSPKKDPAFQAITQQAEAVGETYSSHKSAEEKASEAQEAAEDPSQQTRRAQASQTNEAGEKEPGVFDREAFISSLLNVLGIEKPTSQGDVASGKGAANAADAIKGEVDSSKSDAGGGLQESATRAPEPEAEEPKTVIPVPDATAETGEPIEGQAIDIESGAAAPKPTSEEEIEGEAAQTAEALDNLIPEKIQAKLVVGAPNDKYEQEADRMADKVMAMPDAKVGAWGDRESGIGNRESGVSLQSENDLAEGDKLNPKSIETESLQTKSDRLAPVGKMVQLFPGILIHRFAEGDLPTQEGNKVKLDQHRMAAYQGEAGVDVSGKLDKAKKHNQSAPQKFRQQEEATRNKTIQEQAQQRDTNTQQMYETRLTEHQNVQVTQAESKSQDEIARAEVTQNIQNIYEETQVNVGGILGRMDARVDAEFARSNKRANAIFERRQRQLFAAWKEKYYGEDNPLLVPWMSVKTGWVYVRVKFYLKKFFNTPLWLVNKVFTGLPSEVNEIYEIAKQDFIEAQKEGIYRIADIVEEEMANAKAEVDRGKERVAAYVKTLPDNLQAVGVEAASKVQAQFDSLEQSVKDKQNELVDSLSAKYEASLSEINKRIDELKAANASLISKVADAIGDLAKWILKEVFSVLKPVIQKIPGIGSKADEFIDAFVDDPGGFMNNLFKGIGQGFENFGKNIFTHLKTAFFTWLLGAGMDIKFPKSFDLKGILDIVLQVLGLTKDYIFQLAGDFLPSWAATFLELVVEKGQSAFADIEETLTEMGLPGLVISFFKALISVPTQGIMALWDFIKTGFADLKEQFIGIIMSDVLIPQIIIAGIQWVLGLMNPASGIIKIVKAVIDLVQFFISNIDTIKQVLASIGDVFHAVISGAVGLIATAVEQSLADILPLLLGLFIAILGLNAIPKAVRKVIKTLRKPIDKTVGAVFKQVGKLFDKVAGKVKGKLGIGKNQEDDAEERAENAAEEISETARKDRDPKKVEPEVKKIGKKYQLEKVKFNKPGKMFWNNKKYSVEAKTTQIKAEKKSSDSKSTTKVSRRAVNNSASLPQVQPQLESDIQRSQGNGSTLPQSVQNSMESGFNHDFSGVKIHHDPESDRLSRSLDAEAFTVGQDVYFRRGNYNPQSRSGKELLAHELSHVVQQSPSNSAKIVQRKPVDWKNKKKALIVEDEVSGSKKKAKLQVKAKLIDADDILSNAKKKLKKIIKQKKGKYKLVRSQLSKVKKEFGLASIKAETLNDDGDKYQIIAKADTSGKAQRKAFGGGGVGEIAPGITKTIQRAQGKGQNLDRPTREPMERAFGYDFSPVKIHHDSQSDRLNRSLNARAFTVGGDIFFRQGEYQPETSGGKQILAHELTHVIQQSGGKPQVTPDRGSSSQPRRNQKDYFAANDSLSSLNPGRGETVRRVIHAMGAALAADAIKSGALSGIGGGNDFDIDSKTKDGELIITVKPDESWKKKLFGYGKEEEEEETESEALPDELVGDIVRVIIAIVNQSPEPEVVETKLEDVRRQFELRLVDLVSSAEIGNNYEYVIKVKGKPTEIKPKGIKKFLQDVQNKAKEMGKKALGKANKNDFTKEPEPPTEEPKKIEPTTVDNKLKSDEVKATHESLTKDFAPKPDKKESKLKKAKDKDKNKSSGKPSVFTVDINHKVVRIDKSTVDLKIRANPQSIEN